MFKNIIKSSGPEPRDMNPINGVHTASNICFSSRDGGGKDHNVHMEPLFHKMGLKYEEKVGGSRDYYFEFNCGKNVKLHPFRDWYFQYYYNPNIVILCEPTSCSDGYKEIAHIRMDRNFQILEFKLDLDFGTMYYNVETDDAIQILSHTNERKLFPKNRKTMDSIGRLFIDYFFFEQHSWCLSHNKLFELLENKSQIEVWQEGTFTYLFCPKYFVIGSRKDGSFFLWIDINCPEKTHFFSVATCVGNRNMEDNSIWKYKKYKKEIPTTRESLSLPVTPKFPSAIKRERDYPFYKPASDGFWFFNTNTDTSGASDIDSRNLWIHLVKVAFPHLKEGSFQLTPEMFVEGASLGKRNRIKSVFPNCLD